MFATEDRESSGGTPYEPPHVAQYAEVWQL